MNHLEQLCDEAFKRRPGGELPIVGWFINNYNHSLYETEPLERALIDAFGDSEYLFGGRRTTELRGCAVKVAVTTVSAATGTPVVLANYNRSSKEKRKASRD